MRNSLRFRFNRKDHPELGLPPLDREATEVTRDHLAPMSRLADWIEKKRAFHGESPRA